MERVPIASGRQGGWDRGLITTDANLAHARKSAPITFLFARTAPSPCVVGACATFGR